MQSYADVLPCTEQVKKTWLLKSTMENSGKATRLLVAIFRFYGTRYFDGATRLGDTNRRFP